MSAYKHAVAAYAEASALAHITKDPKHKKIARELKDIALRIAPDAVMSSMETETGPLSDAVAAAWDVGA